MKQTVRLLAVLLIPGLLTLAGCQSVKVNTDYDETVDFARYHTFDWMPRPSDAPREQQLNDIMDNRIKRTIEGALEADGYQKSINGRPDFFVIYHTALRRRLDRAYLDTWGYGPRGRGWRTGTLRVDSYQEGTMIVDVIDAERKELVWRGTATGAVNDLSKAEKKIFEAVERIFAQFPPGGS